MASTLSSKPKVNTAKGYLVTKSSALATESCKLEKQFITAQNMASHYKRVINAKSSIDTNPPSSMIKSQKARDRVKREVLSNNSLSLERAKSSESMKNSLRIDGTDLSTVSKSENTKTAQTTQRVLPNQQKLNKSMSNFMTKFTINPTNKTIFRKIETNDTNEDTKTNFQSCPIYTDKNLETIDNSREALSTLLFNSQSQSNLSLTSPFHPALKAMSRLVAGRNYDLLENHADKFKKPEKEFVPRIINTNSASQLVKESNYYQPPIRRKKEI